MLRVTLRLELSLNRRDQISKKKEVHVPTLLQTTAQRSGQRAENQGLESNRVSLASVATSLTTRH